MSTTKSRVNLASQLLAAQDRVGQIKALFQFRVLSRQTIGF